MSLRQDLKVIVVDDMSTSRALIVQALEAMGIQNVTAVTGAEEAMMSFAKSPAHIVICDYNMPQHNGLDLLDVLRKGASTAQTAFILISGSADPNVLQRGAALGMNNFVLKPFDIQTLKTAIEAVVGRI